MYFHNEKIKEIVSMLEQYYTEILHGLRLTQYYKNRLEMRIGYAERQDFEREIFEDFFEGIFLAVCFSESLNSPEKTFELHKLRVVFTGNSSKNFYPLALTHELKQLSAYLHYPPLGVRFMSDTCFHALQQVINHIYDIYNANPDDYPLIAK